MSLALHYLYRRKVKVYLRLITLFFLTVFLFNMIGYYGLYLIELDRLSAEFSQKVAADEYSGSDARILKIAVSLPYQPNFDGYQRANGTFESNGEFFKIAKYRMQGDTLYVVLVKDNKMGDLGKTVSEFIRSSNGDSSSTKSPLKLLESFFKDFLPTRNLVQAVTPGWCRETKVLPQNDGAFTPVSLRLLSPPPES